MLVSMTSFPCEESRMTTWDLITALFYHVDEQPLVNARRSIYSSL